MATAKKGKERSAVEQELDLLTDEVFKLREAIVRIDCSLRESQDRMDATQGKLIRDWAFCHDKFLTVPVDSFSKGFYQGGMTKAIEAILYMRGIK